MGSERERHKAERKQKKAERREKRKRKEARRLARAEKEAKGSALGSSEQNSPSTAKAHVQASKSSQPSAQKSSDGPQDPKAKSKKSKQTLHADSSTPSPAVSQPFQATQTNPFAPAQTHANPFASRLPLATSSAPFFPNLPPAPAAIDPRLFPPGMDLTALQTQTSNPDSRTPSTSRKVTAADLEKAIARSMSSKQRGKSRSSRLTTTSAPGVNLGKSKEATIEDARGLSEKQILTEKLYQPHQLQWLCEAGMLKTLHKGKFSDSEREAMRAVFDNFCQRRSLSLAEAQELLAGRDKENTETYASLCQEVAASVEGRSLRAVRRYILENFHAGARQGAWTDEQRLLLVQSVQELGTKWVAIGERLGRLTRDCRTRWRDHGEADRALYEQHQQDSSTGKQAETVSAATIARWKASEITILRETVIQLAAEMDIDLGGGGRPPWAVVSAKLGSRSPYDCRRKWESIQVYLKEGFTDEQIAAIKQKPASASWSSRRDDKTLIDRLQAFTPALKANNERMIDWSAIADEEFPFAPTQMSKAWRRLKDRRLTDTSLSYKDQLNALRPIVNERYESWVADHPDQEEMQPSLKRSGWCEARQLAQSEKRAREVAESPTGTPRKRRILKAGEAQETGSPSKGRGSGRGGAYETDLGDVIDSDEE